MILKHIKQQQELNFKHVRCVINDNMLQFAPKYVKYMSVYFAQIHRKRLSQFRTITGEEYICVLQRIGRVKTTIFWKT